MKLTQLALYGAIAYAVMKSGILNQVMGKQANPTPAEMVRPNTDRLSKDRGGDI